MTTKFFRKNKFPLFWRGLVGGLLWLCLPFVLLAQNGVTVSGLVVEAGTVTFNVSWKNTGMPSVWSDSVWVFVDYNNGNAMTRLPLSAGATLTATSAQGEGKVEEVPGNNKGVWVVGNAKTAIFGSFSATVQLLTATTTATGACVYASNYPPVGDYISTTNIAFTGTPPYEIVLTGEGSSTISQLSDGNYYVPEGYQVLSFTDKTGAPGKLNALECKPMMGSIDFSVLPLIAAKGQLASFQVTVVPSDPVVSEVNYTWSASSFNPASGSGAFFSATAPAIPKTYQVTLTAHSAGYCELTKTKEVQVVDCTPVETFSLQASALSFCAGDATGIIFALSGTEAGQGYQLYRGAVPVSSVLTGTGSAATFSGGPFNVPGMYTAVSVADGGYCALSMGASRVITENPLPLAPVILQPADVCLNDGDIVFTITDYSGTPTWTSTGGGVVNGLSITFGSSSIGTKTVKARSSQTYTNAPTCYSAEVTQSASVRLLPTVASASNGWHCDEGTVNLSATASEGAVIDWYNAATNGVLLPNGEGTNSFITPTISTSTTYYVQARVGVAGCVSATRTPVLASIIPNPKITTQPVGISVCAGGTVTLSVGAASVTTYQWLKNGQDVTDGSGGMSATYTTGTLSSDATYDVVVFNSACSITSNSALVTALSLPATPAPVPGSRCGAGTVSLSAASGGMVVDWYSTPTGGTVLSGGSATNSFTTPSISTSTTYYAAARNLLTGCESAPRAAVLATIDPDPSTPTGVDAGLCEAGIITIVASSGDAYIDWYDKATGRALLHTGNSYTFNLTKDTTFYAEARSKAAGCLSTARKAIAAAIYNPNFAPPAPTAWGNGVCGEGAVQVPLQAAPPCTMDAVIEWYSAPTGGSPLFTGNTYSVLISSNTTYYAQARYTSTGLVSATRTPVPAEILPLPRVASVNPISRCNTGAVDIGVAINNTWYNKQTGGNQDGYAYLYTSSSASVTENIATSNRINSIDGSGGTLTTPALTANTTYYVGAYDANTGCYSQSKTSALARVNTPGSLSVNGTSAATISQYSYPGLPMKAISISSKSNATFAAVGSFAPGLSIVPISNTEYRITCNAPSASTVSGAHSFTVTALDNYACTYSARVNIQAAQTIRGITISDPPTGSTSSAGYVFGATTVSATVNVRPSNCSFVSAGLGTYTIRITNGIYYYDTHCIEYPAQRFCSSPWNSYGTAVRATVYDIDWDAHGDPGMYYYLGDVLTSCNGICWGYESVCGCGGTSCCNLSYARSTGPSSSSYYDSMEGRTAIRCSR